MEASATIMAEGAAFAVDCCFLLLVTGLDLDLANIAMEREDWLQPWPLRLGSWRQGKQCLKTLASVSGDLTVDGIIPLAERAYGSFDAELGRDTRFRDDESCLICREVVGAGAKIRLSSGDASFSPTAPIARCHMH